MRYWSMCVSLCEGKEGGEAGRRPSLRGACYLMQITFRSGPLPWASLMVMQPTRADMKIRSLELTSGAHGGSSRIIAPSSAAYAVPRFDPSGATRPSSACCTSRR